MTPRDYPEVSSQVADRTTLGGLHFEKMFATLHIYPLPGWTVKADKEMVSNIR